LADTRLKLLVIEDDDLVANSIRLSLPAHWRMLHWQDPTLIPRESFSAALVDMHLSPHARSAEGLKLIEKLQTQDPHLEIIAMSGDLNRDLMEAGLKAGASRFLAKPLSTEELLLTLNKIEALELHRQATVRGQSGQTAWLGTSEAAASTRRNIAALRGEPGPILIEGESGTGKEVAAHLIHFQEQAGDSPANRRPFVAINLGALPENVFESEFFGHVRGAFTGADQNKMGLAEAAHGGDLFLDEIEALPLSQQAKLLRFLENGEVRRVGAKDSIRVHIRVIAATNQNLEQMARDGKFREDLLWRLNGRKLDLPSLRQRPEDIGLLSEHFLALERPRRNKTFSPEAIECLKRHNWPGNVRELRRTCEQIALHSPLPIVRANDVLRFLPLTSSNESSANPRSLDLSLGLNAALEAFEAEAIRTALKKVAGDIDLATAMLQISRSSLYKKMKDYNIENRS
jgi:DNA-binding NtrC family response regulator